jgi:cytochrome c553
MDRRMSTQSKLSASIVVTALVGSLVAAVASAAAAGNPDPKQLQEAGRRIAVATCASCHGPHGVSALPKIPSLAGQPANYLAAQLEAFRAHTRQEPDAIAYMWGISTSLDERQIAALAAYYAAQSPKEGSSRDPDEEARGKSVYEAGIPGRHVAPCSGCHGAKAEGNGDWPRLAGERVPYFIAQMNAFQSSLRDGGDIMRAVATRLGPEDIDALAAYLQSR